MAKTLQSSFTISNDLEDIGRQCYYALYGLNKRDKTVNMHIERILEILGITEPKQVGLSNSGLRME
jgi:hypothetical protein